MKKYLGDSAYAEITDFCPICLARGELKLTIEDGHGPTNIIILKEETLAALEEFLRVNRKDNNAKS